MCKSSRVTALKLIVDNSRESKHSEHLLDKAVQAYWQARQSEPRLKREDAAIEFLVPLRTGSPRGLAQKVHILEDMVETQRSAEQLAEFAASIADEALSMSRKYLNCAV